MAKLIALAFVAMSLVPSAAPVGERFARYKAIEAYEIRPGVLILPRYAPDGQVCEIGIERLHYSPETVRVDSSLTREEIDLAFDELVPADERGPKVQGLQGDLIVGIGADRRENIAFENVSLQIASEVLSESKRHVTLEPDVVAIIQWKHRKCQ